MSLRDELAQVLASHELRYHVSFSGQKEGVGYECGCGAEGMGYHDAHQADAVIAHLALTEQWSYCGDEPPWRKERRYVTPWEDA